jgi:hypothetical protein
MTDSKQIFIHLRPEHDDHVDLEKDEDWQQECQELFFAVRKQLLQKSNQVNLRAAPMVTEEGSKDVGFIFSTLIILSPALIAFAPHLIEVIKSLLQFRQSKKLVLKETIKFDGREYTREVEFNGPIDKEALRTMEDFLAKRFQKELISL